MNCPICNNCELSHDAENRLASCPQCGSDIEIFTLIEAAKKESTFQKKSGIILIASLGIVLISWGSTSYFNDGISQPILSEVKSDSTASIETAIDTISSVEPILKTESAKDETAPIVTEKKKLNEESTVTKVPVNKEKERVKVEAPSNQGDVIIHKVKNGESLWLISKKYFGNGNHAKQIAADNNVSVKKTIPTGTKLKINK